MWEGKNEERYKLQMQERRWLLWERGKLIRDRNTKWKAQTERIREGVEKGG